MRTPSHRDLWQRRQRTSKAFRPPAYLFYATSLAITSAPGFSSAKTCTTNASRNRCERSSPTSLPAVQPRSSDSHQTRLSRCSASIAASASALEKRGYVLGTDDTLTRLPREYADRAGTPREPYLKLKSFIVSKELDPKTLRDPDLGKTIVAFAKHATPRVKPTLPGAPRIRNAITRQCP